MGKDWNEWHRGYDESDSSLSQRLDVVVSMIRDHLDTAPPGAIHVLSLCAGDARDLCTAARGHPRAGDLAGVLVELEPTLAAAAEARIDELDLDLEVRVANAGATSTFLDVTPVDLLLLCGILGNIDDDDVERMLRAAPQLCHRGATMIWTRHRRPPDLTPRIREILDSVGVESLRFASPGGESFAVGAERIYAPNARRVPEQLFSFRSDLW